MASTHPRYLPVMHTKLTLSVMNEFIGNDSHIASPHFFPYGLKVNALTKLCVWL